MAVSIPTKPVARVAVEVGPAFSDASGGRRRRPQIAAALADNRDPALAQPGPMGRVERRGSHISDSIACRLPCSQSQATNPIRGPIPA
jgi:hypothetical protein